MEPVPKALTVVDIPEHFLQVSSCGHTGYKQFELRHLSRFPCLLLLTLSPALPARLLARLHVSLGLR